MTPGAAAARRSENLALKFQELLTAVVRLRSDRQGASDAESFRQQVREALKTAANDAIGIGYSAQDTRLAAFAVVGFLDESILNAQNPLFAEWPRKPLQEELFGTHMAGEVFFQNLRSLLSREDSHDLADLLEVYYLCILLGYRGRYSAGGGELHSILSATADKIRRIRGAFAGLSPAWALPPEPVRVARDTWTRRLGLIALGLLVLALLLFTCFKVSLASGESEIGAVAGGTRR